MQLMMYIVHVHFHVSYDVEPPGYLVTFPHSHVHVDAATHSTPSSALTSRVVAAPRPIPVIGADDETDAALSESAAAHRSFRDVTTPRHLSFVASTPRRGKLDDSLAVNVGSATVRSGVSAYTLYKNQCVFYAGCLTLTSLLWLSDLLHVPN